MFKCYSYKYKYENILVSNCLYLLYIYLSDTHDYLFLEGHHLLIKSIFE